MSVGNISGSSSQNIKGAERQIMRENRSKVEEQGAKAEQQAEETRRRNAEIMKNQQAHNSSIYNHIAQTQSSSSQESVGRNIDTTA